MPSSFLPSLSRYAHGSILNESVSALLNGVYSYLEEQVVEALNGTKSGHNLKPFFVDLVANLGLAVSL